MDLKKKLGFFDVVAISSGAMISSGLFVLPGLAFAQAGPAVFVSYFLAGVLALSAVLSLAELTTAMPRAGGDYFYVTRTFGGMLGSVSGLLSWFALSLKTAFAIIGIGEILSVAFGFDFTLSSLVLTVFFVLLNLAGVKEASRFQVALVVMLLVILLAFIVFGFPQVRTHRFIPFAPHGVNAVFMAAGFVFVSFGGLLTTASIAEEVRVPRRNLPLGLLVSLISVTLLYTLVPMIAIGVLPGQGLSASLSPIADSAAAIAGRPGYLIMVFASLLAFITTANGGILTASRYPMALARDSLLPPLFARVSHRFHTPTIATLITGLFIALSMVLRLEVLVKAASTVVLLTNILANLSLIILRESRVLNYRPSFRAPLYPWLQIAGIAVFAFLIGEMGLQAGLFSLLFVLTGILMYLVYGRRRASSDSALLHLVARVTNRRLGSRDLETELKQIIFERDKIARDEFDLAVERAAVLDIDRPMSPREFFTVAAGEFCRRGACTNEEEIVRLLAAREAESTTAISPFAAIPHIVLEGSGVFRLLLARAPKGISFSPKCPSVKAVFVLIGTRDRRNLHLRSLAAIAQALQNERFERLWMRARGAGDLRDIVLLSERKRS